MPFCKNIIDCAMFKKEATKCHYDNDACFRIKHLESGGVQVIDRTCGSAVKRLVSREVYERAIRHYGFKKQAGQAMEECGELITAIHKYFFRLDIETGAMMIAEEIADVQIMCEQLCLILEQEGYVGIVEQAKICKLQRLNGKIARDIFVG